MTDEEAIEILKDLWRYEHSKYSEKEVRDALEKGIEAIENQKTGHWIDYGARYDVRCSICNTQCPLKPIGSSHLKVCKSDYCPSCGAKMKGE